MPLRGFDEVRDKASAIRATRRADADAVRADKRLTEPAKRERLTAIDQTAREQMDALKAQRRELVEQTRARLKVAAFRITSDGARAALARAEAISDGANGPKALERMLTLAATTSDDVSRRAALAVAADRGYHVLIARHGTEEAKAYLRFERERGDLADARAKFAMQMETGL